MLNPANAFAVVTAAGASTRMGRPKALLGWGGKPLLQHQLDHLIHWSQVIVVLGHEAEAIRAAIAPAPNVTVVVNPAYAEGRSSSLTAAFSRIAPHAEAVLVAGVDQPLEPDVLDSLLTGMTPEASYAVPIVNGRRGHPVLFSGRLLDDLKGVSREADGLKGIVRRHEGACVEVPIPNGAALLDLNTPEQYTAACIARYPRHS